MWVLGSGRWDPFNPAPAPDYSGFWQFILSNISTEYRSRPAPVDFVEFGPPRRGGDRRPRQPSVIPEIPGPVAPGPTPGILNPDVSGPYYLPGASRDLLPKWLRDWLKKHGRPSQSAGGWVVWEDAFPVLRIPKFEPTPGIIPWEVDEVDIPLVLGPLGVEPVPAPGRIPRPTPRRRPQRRFNPAAPPTRTPQRGPTTRPTRPRIRPGQPVIPVPGPMFPGRPGNPPFPAPPQPSPRSPTVTPRPAAPEPAPGRSRPEPPPRGTPNETVPMPAPTATPGQPAPLPEPERGTGPAGRPAPASRPAPATSSPAPSPWKQIGDLLQWIVPAPNLSPRTTPRTRWSTRSNQGQDLTALNQPSVGYAQQPEPQPEPCRETARRNQRRRKRKKPKERTVCYRGTYYENPRGLTKRRKEKIPCRRSRKKPA